MLKGAGLPAWLRVSTLTSFASLKLLGKLCAGVWGKMDEKGARGGSWEEEQDGCWGRECFGESHSACELAVWDV